MKYEIYFKTFLIEIEKTLKEVLPRGSDNPAELHGAMHYAVFSGGKRFRPILCLAACEAVSGKYETALEASAALELIHAYSLVHDDLPALDNDDVRRGKPTCHKRYGESTAVLTGDALLTHAFQVLAKVEPSDKACQLALELSTEAGSYGMIGGQYTDLSYNRSERDLPTLDYISIHKTGKLIRASAVCGAIAAGASKQDRERMQKFGELLGMAFQSVDDFIDGDGYMQVMKPQEIRDKIRDLIAKAKKEIRPFGKTAEKLVFLADYLIDRMPKKSHVSVD